MDQGQGRRRVFPGPLGAGPGRRHPPSSQHSLGARGFLQRAEPPAGVQCPDVSRASARKPASARERLLSGLLWSERAREGPGSKGGPSLKPHLAPGRVRLQPFGSGRYSLARQPASGFPVPLRLSPPAPPPEGLGSAAVLAHSGAFASVSKRRFGSRPPAFSFPRCFARSILFSHKRRSVRAWARDC